MPSEVTVLSKEGCHLCEKVIRVLLSLASRYRFSLRVLDIESDRELHDRYWMEIPAVLVDGRVVFDAKDISLDGSYEKKLELLVGPNSPKPR